MLRNISMHYYLRYNSAAVASAVLHGKNEGIRNLKNAPKAISSQRRLTGISRANVAVVSQQRLHLLTYIANVRGPAR